MRKRILKGTILKTPFHSALFRMTLSSHCTFSGSNFCNAKDKSRFILGNIYDWNVFVNFISLFKRFYYFWFPADQGLKKVILLLFLKLVKILYDSELTSYQNTSFIISF